MANNICCMVVVVDEHALSREALSLLLARALPDAMVLEIEPGQQPFPSTAAAPHLTLFCLRPPYLQSLAALQELRERFPETRLVLLTDVVDSKVIQMARSRGASGLFHTSGSSEELLAMMRHLIKGRPGFPEAERPAIQPDYRFTPRQTEVLNLLCQGKSNKEIGVILSMSEHTVRTHVSTIFAILGARNRTEAVMAGRHLIPGRA